MCMPKVPKVKRPRPQPLDPVEVGATKTADRARKSFKATILGQSPATNTAPRKTLLGQ